jgi:hypothetical protein
MKGMHPPPLLTVILATRTFHVREKREEERNREEEGR